MQWNRWYAAKSYLNSALWIVPLVALLLENVVIRVVFNTPSMAGLDTVVRHDCYWRHRGAEYG